MTHTISIDYYSDVLCVWAWVAQARLDALQKEWGNDVEIHHHFVDIFGDSFEKIPRQWGGEQGFEKFHQHVVKSAAPFEHISIHPDVWTSVRPRSSAQAHLILKGAQLIGDANSVETLALRIRSAFFAEAQDIGKLDVLLALAVETGLDKSALQSTLEDGSAVAALSSDLRVAADKGIKGSPTWELNEGRQLLYGNVGYRILSANIEELLRNPSEEASWC